MTRHFVLGNGKSRLKIDPKSLQPYGKIYGCNALYREFSPDYLIAVDPKMILEIQESNYQLSHEVWTNLNQKYQYNYGFKYFNPRLGWSSGPSALQLSVNHNPSEIFILGFDFSGIDDKFNNVYADTFNYKSSSDIPTYWGNWEKQTQMIVKNNPHIKFYRVVDDIFYDTKWYYKNFKIIKISEFLIQINNFV
jgi:hypothetical protein